MGAFVFAEHAAIAAELVSGARVQGGSVSLLSIAGTADDFIAAGADEVVVLSGTSIRPEDYAHAIADLLDAEGASLFLVESSVRGRELAALVAGYLDCAMFSDISSLEAGEGAVSVSRNTYGGAVVSRETTTGIAVATAGPGVFEVSVIGGVAPVRTVEMQADNRVRPVSEDPLPKGGVDLSVADRIVGVGLGLDKEEDLPIIQDLANALGAEIGCTRDMAEGRGWIPKEQYIGITGVIVKPSLYLAVGLSGAMQHVYGIRGAKVVVGINKDENASIFRTADYGIIGDLYDVVPKLTEAIRAL